MVDIWIDPKDKESIIKAIQEYEEGDPLYDEFRIDELYIDESTGDIEGFVSVGPIGVGMDIPFQMWFREFVRLRAFESLEKFLSTHQKAVENALNFTQELNEEIQASEGSESP